MKVFTFAWILVLSVSAARAQESDPRKEADIRELLEITGSATVALQVIDNMIVSMKMSKPVVPDSFWEEFRNEVDAQELLNLIVPIYDRHFTHDEIRAIIAFYETPVGLKFIEMLPAITQESMQAGQEWGMRISLKVIERLQEKGLD